MAEKDDKNYYKSHTYLRERLLEDRGWDEPEYKTSNRPTITPLDMTESEYQKRFLELMGIAIKTKDTSSIDELFELKRRGELGNSFSSPKGTEKTEELLWEIGTGNLSWEDVATTENDRVI